MTSRQIRDAARKCDCPGCAEEKMLAREAHLRACERAVVEAAERREDALIELDAANDDASYHDLMRKVSACDDDLQSAVAALREAKRGA